MAEKKSLREELVKNSWYNLLKSIINKVGGLVFTIIIARLLLPEYFGLYSITLSVVLIFMTIADLGVNATLLRYALYHLGRKNFGKVRQYSKYLFKLKIIIILLAAVLLAIIAKPLAVYFFNKPELFYLILISITILIVYPLEGFMETFFCLSRNLKKGAITELILQLAKICFTLVAIFILSDLNRVAGIFLAWTLATLLVFPYIISFIFKKFPYILKKVKFYSINKKDVFRFMGFVSIGAISTIIFGSIDTIMLGRFVSSGAVGQYRVALSIITSVGSLLLLTFVVFPIFTQLSRIKISLVLTKINKYLLLIIVPTFIGLLIVGPQLIVFIFGKEYLIAACPLYALLPILFFMPFVSVYYTLLQARGEVKVAAKSVVYSLIINIFLNYVLIKFLLAYGEIYAITGSGIAISISQLVLLLLCVQSTKKKLGICAKSSMFYFLIKPVIASLIMGSIVFVFTRFIRPFSGLLLYIAAIVVGIVLYALILYIINGITKEEIEDLKLLYKKK